MFDYESVGYPAFPTNEGDNFDGMHLRDYFAAKAMPALMSAYWNSDSMIDPTYKSVANNAYHLADAMMEARK